MPKELNNSEHSRAKVNRGVAALTALSLLATGCVATEQGGQVSAKIIDEPTKTSPLPSNFTKTPAPLSTEANYELTPTVQNPATQELTLVSPTEVATQMPTATKTEMPTPTKEKSLIEGNIFFDPQSKEDFKDVALSPSPIDEPEKFALWREEYLKLVNEKLINYSGPSLTTENMLIGYNYNQLNLSSSEWPVIASYIFDYEGEKILTKTFVFKDGNTDLLVPLSATYPPENSYYFMEGYGTHRTGVVEDMTLVYDYGQYIRDINEEYFTKQPFMEAFFGDFISGEEYGAFARVLFGEANKEDLESFSRQPFVLMSVMKRP